jgi:hypothetical protein
MTDVTKFDDMIDVRDVIARVEQLEAIAEDVAAMDADDADELATLTALLESMKGYGGDEEWRGDWYPGTLVRDSYFEDYAQELAGDCGMINADATWPNNCIDWERAARELRMDYSATEFDGVTYWYR